jgi:hypothetical protein
MTQKAAIAVFAYNRPAHLQRLLHSLLPCLSAPNHEVFFFCDGPIGISDFFAVRSTRKVVDKFVAAHGGFKFEKTRNEGLAQSICKGVSLLFREFERVVVLEDDLVVNPKFLDYHVMALERYATCDQVMQVSGFSHRGLSAGDRDCCFLPAISTWGWSTWRRAWNRFDPQEIKTNPPRLEGGLRHAFDQAGTYPYSRMLEDAVAGRNSSWGVLWNWCVFSSKGLVLNPPRSLVYNTGFDGSGTHCRRAPAGWQEDDEFVAKDVDLLAWRFPQIPVLEDDCVARFRRKLSEMRADSRSVQKRFSVGKLCKVFLDRFKTQAATV